MKRLVFVLVALLGFSQVSEAQPQPRLRPAPVVALSDGTTVVLREMAKVARALDVELGGCAKAREVAPGKWLVYDAQVSFARTSHYEIRLVCERGENLVTWHTHYDRHVPKKIACGASLFDIANNKGKFGLVVCGLEKEDVLDFGWR
jgi:hypothetical protein